MRFLSKLRKTPKTGFIPESVYDTPRVNGLFGEILWVILYLRAIKPKEMKFEKVKTRGSVMSTPEIGFTFGVEGGAKWAVVKYIEGNVYVVKNSSEITAASNSKDTLEFIFNNDKALFEYVHSFWLQDMRDVFEKGRKDFFNACVKK